MGPGHQQFFRREPRDHLAAILRDHYFFLQAGRRPAVRGGPVSFQREDHSLFDHFGMIEGNQAAKDRLFPDREADAMAVLQRESGLFVGKAKFFGLGPELNDVRRGNPGLDDTDRRLYASIIAGAALPTANVR
jgi:hypothetical protein